MSAEEAKAYYQTPAGKAVSRQAKTFMINIGDEPPRSCPGLLSCCPFGPPDSQIGSAEDGSTLRSGPAAENGEAGRIGGWIAEQSEPSTTTNNPFGRVPDNKEQ